jgi:hypothetical protein
MLNVTYAECLISALYAECHYAECHSAESYAECRGALNSVTDLLLVFWRHDTQHNDIKHNDTQQWACLRHLA